MTRYPKIIACCLLAVSLSGCGEEIEPGRTRPEPAVVRGLTLQKAQLELLSRGESYVGTVESRDRGVLSARIDGQVVEMPAGEGQVVQKGDLLMVLDDNQAAAGLAEARAAVVETEGALAAARAGLDLAEKTYRRYARLQASEAVTPREMDGVEARLEQARQQVVQARAARARALSAADAARTTESWTRVKAPYAARVVRRHVQVGSTVMPGTPLLSLDRRSDWQVRASVPESSIDRILVGQELRIELPARGLVLSGTVREIVPTADAQSRSFEIKVALADAPQLAAGLFARVRAPAPSEQVLLVPAAALVERGQLHGLYLVADGRMHFRLVRVGRRLGERVEILSGLDPGDTVVAAGVERARDGARLEGG